MGLIERGELAPGPLGPEVLLGAAGFALDADEEALVDEAVGDGAGSGLVVSAFI